MIALLYNAVLLIAVLATFVGVASYCAGWILSSAQVRDLLRSIQEDAHRRGSRLSLVNTLRLGLAMLHALFEDANGFAFKKFLILTLVINIGAVYGTISNANIGARSLVGMADAQNSEGLFNEADAQFEAIVFMILFSAEGRPKRCVLHD